MGWLLRVLTLYVLFHFYEIAADEGCACAGNAGTRIMARAQYYISGKMPIVFSWLSWNIPPWGSQIDKTYKLKAKQEDEELL